MRRIAVSAEIGNRLSIELLSFAKTIEEENREDGKPAEIDLGIPRIQSMAIALSILFNFYETNAIGNSDDAIYDRAQVKEIIENVKFHFDNSERLTKRMFENGTQF